MENESDDRLTRTLSHELGHAVGLKDYDPDSLKCSKANSVMPGVTAASHSYSDRLAACTSTGSIAFTPQASDILPTTQSTYGNKNQVTCGY